MAAWAGAIIAMAKAAAVAIMRVMPVSCEERIRECGNSPSTGDGLGGMRDGWIKFA
ncbi:hypothetical protein GCM10008966_04200 [Rhodovulum strictum]